MLNTAQQLYVPWSRAHVQGQARQIARLIQLGETIGRAMAFGTLPRRHVQKMCRVIELPDGTSKRLTRGETKRLRRQETVAKILAERAEERARRARLMGLAA
jgi:hypothetical protein